MRMMMTAALAALLATGAMATNVRALSDAEARSLAEASADVRVTTKGGSAHQAQRQRQSARTGDVTGSQDVTISTGDDRAAAGAYAATVFPTAPCVIPASGGVQGVTFGVSIAGGITDLVCQGVTLATGAHQIGRQDIADVAMEAALAEYLDAVTPRAVPVNEGGFPP